MSTKIQRIDQNHIIDLYSSLRNIPKIIEITGLSEYLIVATLKKYNIDINKRRIFVNDLNHSKVIEDYMDTRDIKIVAKKYGVSITLITKVLRLNNIVRKKKISENNIIMPKKTHYPSDEEIIKKYRELQHFTKTYEELKLNDAYVRKVLIKNNIDIYHGRIEVGDRFGKLTVIKILEPKRSSTGQSKRMVECECECGEIKKYHAQKLRKKTNCGCEWENYRKETSIKKEKEKLEKIIRYRDQQIQRQYNIEIRRNKKKEKKKNQELRWESTRPKIGNKINKLTIISNETHPGESIKMNDIAIVHCECGKEVKFKGLEIRVNKSCGCGKNPLSNTVGHLFQNKKEYDLMYARHKNMKKRCYNINCSQWINYGMRGISVCDRWMGPKGWGFINFCNDMGPRPSEKHSIDRINNDGNYEPSNCQWATASQQARNQRKNRRIKSPPIPF